ITAEGPLQLAEMFKVGSSVIDSLPAAIDIAAAANSTRDSAAIRTHAVREARASASARLDRGDLHQARHGSGDVSARMRWALRTKRIVLAKNDASNAEKSHRTIREEARAHGTSKAAQGAAQGRHVSTRRRSKMAGPPVVLRPAVVRVSA